MDVDDEGVVHAIVSTAIGPHGEPRYVSHFATCPEAKRFRQKQ